MSQLHEVTERHRFDVARLSAFLSDKLPDWKGPLDVKQFQGGQSNPTYLLDPHRQALRDAQQAGAGGEAAAVGACGRTRISCDDARWVPRAFRCLARCCSVEDETVIGRAFFVMEHVEGRILWDQCLPAASRAERGAIYDEMNRVIARAAFG